MINTHPYNTHPPHLKYTFLYHHHHHPYFSMSHLVALSILIQCTISYSLSNVTINTTVSNNRALLFHHIDADKLIEIQELEDLFLDLTDRNLVDIITKKDWDNDDIWDHIHKITTTDNDVVHQKCSDIVEICGCKSFDIYGNHNIYACNNVNGIKSNSKLSKNNEYYQYYQYDLYDDPEVGHFVSLKNKINNHDSKIGKIIKIIPATGSGQTKYVIQAVENSEHRKTIMRDEIIYSSSDEFFSSFVPQVGDIAFLKKNGKSGIITKIRSNSFRLVLFDKCTESKDIEKTEISSYSKPDYQLKAQKPVVSTPEIGDKVLLGKHIKTPSGHDIIAGKMGEIMQQVNINGGKYMVKRIDELNDLYPAYPVDMKDIDMVYKLNKPLQGKYDITNVPHLFINPRFVDVPKQPQPQSPKKSIDPKKPYGKFAYGYKRNINLQLATDIGNEKESSNKYINKLYDEFVAFNDKFVFVSETKFKDKLDESKYRDEHEKKWKNAWEKYNNALEHEVQRRGKTVNQKNIIKYAKGIILNEAECFAIYVYTSYTDFCTKFRTYWRFDPHNVDHTTNPDFIKDEDVEYLAAAFWSALHKYKPDLLSEINPDKRKWLRQGNLMQKGIWLWHGVTSKTDVSNFKQRDDQKNAFWKTEMGKPEWTSIQQTTDPRWLPKIKTVYGFTSPLENNQFESFYGPMSWTFKANIAINFARDHGSILTITKNLVKAMIFNNPNKLRCTELNSLGYLPDNTVKHITEGEHEEETILMNFDVNIMSYYHKY
eukprot:472725_1